MDNKSDLERRVDVLEEELSNLNDLLINCGFEDGVKTLKQAAEEMLESSK